MVVYFLILSGLYFLFLLGLLTGWKKSIKKIPTGVDSARFISIVVAVRNEEDTIALLIESVLKLNYNRNDFELILVDDHSTDQTLSLVKPFLDNLPHVLVLKMNAHEFGKKAAITAGVEAARGEVIATTDADCVLPPDWLQKINQAFTNSACKMVFGPVSLQVTGFFSQVQALEFASIMGVTLGTLGWGHPLLCNGANLAYRKSTFREVNGYEGNRHIASGDDEFLLHKISDRFPGSVCSTDVLVVTRPQSSFANFFQQRIRWAGKWKVNASRLARWLALFIWVVQASWIAFGGMYNFIPFNFFWSVVICKVMSDAGFLFYITNQLKMKSSVFSFIVLQLVYPFYVLGVGFLSLVKKTSWKDRTV
ncbi:MAG: glycosyltransferase [Bacteroidetes bacterium]|nr:glycosyltransferase [Bacteroidota bacterium]